jgi:hypothetical protein
VSTGSHIMPWEVEVDSSVDAETKRDKARRQDVKRAAMIWRGTPGCCPGLWSFTEEHVHDLV